MASIFASLQTKKNWSSSTLSVPRITVGIISWDGMHKAASAIAEAIAVSPVELIVVYSNSENSFETGAGRWIKAPQVDFFGRKFRLLLDAANVDSALFLIQADVKCENWALLVARFVEVIQKRLDIGVWSPTIDNSAFPNSAVATSRDKEGLIGVLQTDAIVLGLAPKVIERLRGMDFTRNNLGWGIDWAAVAYASKVELKVVRDSSQRVHHPKSRGYNSALAETQMNEFLQQLSPEELHFVDYARRAIDRSLSHNTDQYHVSRHFAEEKNSMQPNSADQCKGLFEHVSFAVVERGSLLLALRNPGSLPVLLNDGRIVRPLVNAQSVALPRILDFDQGSVLAHGGTFTTGEEWSCPGQSTLCFAFQPSQQQTRIDLAPEIELNADLGAVNLRMGLAVHRANADLLIEWQDGIDADLSDEVWIKLDPKFSGTLALGDFQRVSVQLPNTGGSRKLRVTLCFWNCVGDLREPGVVFCTKPYLVAATHNDADQTQLVFISDDAKNDETPTLMFPVSASDNGLSLRFGTEEVSVLPAPNESVKLALENESLVAISDLQTEVSLHVNGRLTRTILVGPEPQLINLQSDVLATPGTLVELRDPTGNVIHAHYETPNTVEQQSEGSSVHTLRHPDAGTIEELFDSEFYLSGFAADTRPSDPVSHFLTEGSMQGRDPAPWFSVWHYLSMHPDVAAAGMNPFLHYCIAGRNEGRKLPRLGSKADGDTASVYAAHAYSVSAGPHFEEFDPTIGEGRAKQAKVIAYYLPQFHPVEVNDTQWGKGFTEWRNLPRGMPRFKGHVQPRIPRDLGCYSLHEGDALRRQIDMARAAGLFGFCYYHYWFDGKRVLETPMERMMADPTLDFPFCLMWANENWTRTWDGSDRELILGQTYRDEDDLSFVDDIARHMKDPRYIRIGARPLLFIYRPGHIPNASEKISKWRALFQDHHQLEPIIMMAQGFDELDPLKFGLDGAIEFPPHKICQGLTPINNRLEMLDRNYAGNVLSYDEMVSRSTRETAPDFPLIRTITPTWDNEARRPGRGMVLHGSTPSKFEDWARKILSFSHSNPVFGEDFICVNAWNEWAEGAVLEPDVHHGAAYLNALSRAVHADTKDHEGPLTKVLIVGHDAHINGAQMLALNIGMILKWRFGISVAFVLGGRGPLLDRYRALGSVYVEELGSIECDNIIAELADQGFGNAITNTTPSGQCVLGLKKAGFKVLSLIHELPNLLKSYRLEDSAKQIAEASDHVIFPAEIVRKGFEGFVGSITHTTEVFPQGLYNTSVLEMTEIDNDAAAELRAEFGLKRATKIVLGAGYADLRKGIDRFVSIALSICGRNKDIAFFWVGSLAAETLSWFQPEVEAAGASENIRFLGQRDDIARFFAGADAFYLSSREDPFPSVVLEALACGLPVVGHEGCGGCDDLIRRHGVLVSQDNPFAAGPALIDVLETRNEDAASARRAEVIENYDFASYVFGLVQRLAPQMASVSAVVPNYKYETYIGDRLRSVFDQTYPVREVIVLDDASPDGSVAEIIRTAEKAGRMINLRVNAKNSGSPFRQWRKGVELAQGDYVWIAEADDLADPSFVGRIVEQMRRAGSVLGFTDSRQIDKNSERLADSYRPYINQIEPGAFDRPFDMDGHEFLSRFLAVKNVILNVSGVIMHRQTLLQAFDSVGDDLYRFSVAGDWRLYAEICWQSGAVVSWLPDSLNTHRRHQVSVTHALKADLHLGEIEGIHELVGEKLALSERTVNLQISHLEECRSHLFGTN